MDKDSTPETTILPQPQRAAWHHGLPTLAVMLAASAATLASWGKLDISVLHMSYRVFEGQIWRLLTSALVHADVIHLVFNLFWLHRFGIILEREFGPWRTLILMAVLAAVSGVAEFLFFVGGSGLSGVVYGLFGMLWWLQRCDPRFAKALDRNTTRLFAAWFFICIALTVTNVLPIGNVAHGVGAVYGVGIGWAVTASKAQRMRRWTVLMVSATMLYATTAFARSFVNLSSQAAAEYAFDAYSALQRNENERAAALYSQAVRLAPHDAGSWFNYAIALQRIHEEEKSLSAYQRAFELEPTSVVFRNELVKLDAYFGAKYLASNRDAEAVRALEETVRLDDSIAATW